MKNAIRTLGFAAIALAFFALSMSGCESPSDTTPAHVHTWGAWSVTTAATCTAKGVETRTCSLESTHKETRETAIDPTAHVWGEWEVQFAPTCTKIGKSVRVCLLDETHDEYDYLDVDPDAHDWEEWHRITVTCTEPGSGTRWCRYDYTHTQTEEALDALGHDLQWKTT